MPEPATTGDVIARVRTLSCTVPDRTCYVGIDGFAGSGKTTLAAEIAAAVERVVVVHVDDFARPGVPEWEWDRFATQLLAPLRAGASARYQVWNWDRDSGGDRIDVRPGAVLVIEGVSATRREVTIDWDITVWVAAPRELRLQRAVERDGAELLDTWLTRWMPSEQAWAERDRPQERVDLVVDGAAGVRDLGQSTVP